MVDNDWFTKLTIGDWTTPGSYHPIDRRIPLFFERHRNLSRVLELSCFEGGHTIALAERCDEVVAIDGRQRNIEKATESVSRAGYDNVTFHCLDLEQPIPEALGKFSAVFCLGLLYHMHNPVRLLKDIRRLSPEVYISTHVGEPKSEHEGYKGWWYAETAPQDPRSGLLPKSFWPAKTELMRAMHDCGWDKVYCEDANDIPVLHGGYAHQGPYVILSAVASEAKK